jgi:hypothetical protein
MTPTGGARPGAGRKPLPPDEKAKVRSIKITDAEWNQWDLVAKQHGLSITEAIRQAMTKTWLNK